MNERQKIRASKYLSKHLRHAPERIGLQLQPGGWVEVADLLEACRKHHFPLSRAELEAIVADNPKQRFAFDETGQKIRANQGHSVAVDLQLEPQSPPDELFHGSAEINRQGIERDGLRAMARHHVHLSTDVETARQVGARHGKSIVFRVDARAMSQSGVVFYRSQNGVWLCDEVAPQFLDLYEPA